jgi:ABC-2 type transport system permease protein
MISRTHVISLLRKEMLDLLRNRSALLPAVLVTILALALPFTITLAVPMVTGEGLGEDRELLEISAAVSGGAPLTDDGRVQLFMFQQFLMLFLLTPITGAMSLAAHSVVGEKLARTLEPLLATPISTLDLLIAKVFGALLPTLAVAFAGLAIYVSAVAAFAEPGVFGAMMSLRSLLLVFMVGPAAALLSLQTAIVISSRVNDPRTAQQFGVLIVLPLTFLLVAQFTGSLWLSAGMLATIGAGMLAAWAALLLFSAALFERETILTRWK